MTTARLDQEATDRYTPPALPLLGVPAEVLAERSQLEAQQPKERPPYYGERERREDLTPEFDWQR